MSKSIISNEEKCFICDNPMNLHRHHIYPGMANRKQSEKYGCWVYLCAYHHNMSDHSVHYDHSLDWALRRLCQKEWEKRYGDRQAFIRAFGRSYIDD